MSEHGADSLWMSFMPHGHCYQWVPWILWSHVISDALVAAAYFSIPFCILYFALRRKDATLNYIYILFALFIFTCGAGHVLDIITVWHPIYHIQAAVKVVIAISSVATAIILWPVTFRAVNIPSRRVLEDNTEALRLANERYNLLLEGSGVGTFEWHRLEDPEKVVFWSDRLYELLGFRPNSFVPTIELFFSLVHPDDREMVEESFRQTIKSGGKIPLEFRMRVLTDYRWFRARRMVRSMEKNQSQFLVGSLEDINEQKVSEEKILAMNTNLEEEVKRRTSQVELANQAKTRFLANMSHEMRTPLGLILGFSELLEDAKSLGPEAKEYIRLISKNGEILSRVINDLLDLSKIEAGKLVFQYSKIKLQDLVDYFHKAFVDQAASKKVALSIQNLCPDDEFIVTDEIRLKQIVYNLLSNALKFTDSGSVHMTIGKRGETYYLDVVDTGIGIPVHEKAKLFQEYVRGELATSSGATGTGLGLRLAQNLARRLGGNVELVTSQVGKGSHFRATFQSDESQLMTASEQHRENVASTNLESILIYVLDDNEDNVRLAEIFLKKLKCQVRGFVSYQDLLSEVNKKSPDLILLDIHMPEKNGFEVLDLLKAESYEGLVWALTAYGMNEDVERIKEHGFDDYIRKPITIDGMRKKLSNEFKERFHE
ncbi:MAG: hypothetical protein COT73_06390 [Bdellovibrio sp. CG10_big_fil_rev_8_21_14_0_10_47_8]|nr:MAG: hypothetical protein COT73_06390 [Bdellovibrio sp. CG10_big_fil_rev_8_21_14_0_10_47_8]